jgi:hypothetical protein
VRMRALAAAPVRLAPRESGFPLSGR